MNIIQSPSLNFGNRQGHKPEVIVIHATDGFFPGDLEWLRGAPGSQVSSHYLIAPEGTVYALVDDFKTAWHAGLVVNPTAPLKMEGLGIVNPNLYTLGIETSLKIPGTIKAEQWAMLKELVRSLCEKHQIPIDRKHIWAHKEIRADKACPGSIDVNKLVQELAAIPPPPVAVDKEAIKKQIISLLNQL